VARADEGLMRVRVIHGDALEQMLARTKPQITYWPAFRTSEYDSAEQLDANWFVVMINGQIRHNWENERTRNVARRRAGPRRSEC
jgi:hypothetical protein